MTPVKEAAIVTGTVEVTAIIDVIMAAVEATFVTEPMVTTATTRVNVAITTTMPNGKRELLVPGPSFPMLACLKQGPCDHGAVSLQENPKVAELCFQVAQPPQDLLVR